MWVAGLRVSSGEATWQRAREGGRFGEDSGVVGRQWGGGKVKE